MKGVPLNKMYTWVAIRLEREVLINIMNYKRGPCHNFTSLNLLTHSKSISLSLSLSLPVPMPWLAILDTIHYMTRLDTHQNRYGFGKIRVCAINDYNHIKIVSYETQLVQLEENIFV